LELLLRSTEGEGGWEEGRRGSERKKEGMVGMGRGAEAIARGRTVTLSEAVEVEGLTSLWGEDGEEDVGGTDWDPSEEEGGIGGEISAETETSPRGGTGEMEMEVVEVEVVVVVVEEVEVEEVESEEPSASKPKSSFRGLG